MPDDPVDPIYDQTVRELLGEIVGCRIVGLTQHDKEEFAEDGTMRVELQLDSGALLCLLTNGDVRLERPDGSSTQIGRPDDEGVGE